MKVDHIGYAVKKLDQARAVFESMGYVFEEVYEDTDRNIYIQFGENQGYRIELISKMDKKIESPLDGIMKKMGPTPYHICYRSSNLAKDIETLQAQGFKITVPPAKAIAFSGRKVVFMMNLCIGLIEIVEESL